MNKIIERLKKYYKKKSLISIIFDVLFYILIILIIIPGTRTQVISTIKRITLIPPLGLNSSSNEKLSEADYQWSFQEMNGKFTNLEQLKGEVIFLNFWATWCPPCIAELPSIEKLHEKYGDRIKIVLISQENPQTVTSFLKKNGYTFPTYISDGSVPGIFKSKSIPTSFLISPDGRIVLKKKGAAKWNSRKVQRMIDKMIAEKGK